MKHGLPRMWDLILVTLIAGFIVWRVAPQQIEVILYKFSLVTLAACVSYWIDRSLYLLLLDRGMVNMNLTRDLFGAARLVSRALIFLGVVLGLTLGV